MLKNSNGFTITEALVSFSIIMVLCITLLPLSSFVSQERNVLSQKRIVIYQLHDELQTALWDGINENIIQRNVGSVSVTIKFSASEGGVIKGCATWVNNRKRQEEVCLYGIREK
jgi:type II secretory pathway pseudopilin PulG